jgi:PadR family transcriptional regulator PadR
VTEPLAILKGMMDLLILKALGWGPLHGYAVSRWIRDTTNETLDIQEGALYPALHRLERKGLVESEWGLSENNRQAKFYKLTAVGRKQLQIELSLWSRFAQAVGKVVTASKPTSALTGR